MSEADRVAVQKLRLRERLREEYWHLKDPFLRDRLLWRAQSFRHLVHLLPGESILELGSGGGDFTAELLRVSRGENRITTLTFQGDVRGGEEGRGPVESLIASSLPGPVRDRSFDFVVGMDLLDSDNCVWLLQRVYELLKPGGRVIFYESNPWNVVLKIRRVFGRMFGRQDSRRLLTRSALYETMSELGFIRIFAVYNDFVYGPLPRWSLWWLRNLSILLENTPLLRSLAGSILVHAQKPPRSTERPRVNLCEHEVLKHAVSVVIPCFNEEMNIRPLVSELKALYGEYLHEIIPVDDNSVDGTRDVMKALADEDPLVKPVFRTPPNGVGRAIADGYRSATGRYVMSMDCDFQHLLPEMRDLFDALARGQDVVVGSRFSRHSVLLNYPFQKIVANRAFHMLVRILFLRRVRDLTNNLKIMRREVIDKLRLTQPGFAVNAETGLQPLLMGYSVEEVPISWINRTPDMGVSSFRLAQVGGGYWQVLIRLWLQTMLGGRSKQSRQQSQSS